MQPTKSHGQSRFAAPGNRVGCLEHRTQCKSLSLVHFGGAQLQPSSGRLVGGLGPRQSGSVAATENTSRHSACRALMSEASAVSCATSAGSGVAGFSVEGRAL